MRRLLDQLAYAALRKAYPDADRLSACWPVRDRTGLSRIPCADWKVLHDNIRYVEHGLVPTPLKRRRQRLVTQLRKMGYQVELTPLVPNPTV
jgi:hypothetical protein